MQQDPDTIAWWREPRAEQLVAVGLVLVASGLAHLLVWAIAGGPWEGPVTWRKPILFGISGGLTSLSAAWVWSQLPPRRGDVWLASAAAWALLVEVFLIDLQKWRGVASHFNRATPLDSFLYDAMGVLILFVTAVLVDLTGRLFRSTAGMPADMLLAARAGMVFLVISCGLGIWVSVNGDIRVGRGARAGAVWGGRGAEVSPRGCDPRDPVAAGGRLGGPAGRPRDAARRRLVLAATLATAAMLAFALVQTLTATPGSTSTGGGPQRGRLPRAAPNAGDTSDRLTVGPHRRKDHRDHGSEASKNSAAI